MIVDLDEKEERGSFELKGGGSVDLRLATADEVKSAMKACVKVNPEYPLLKDPETGKESYKRFEGREFDGDLFEEMMWDFNIIGWKAIFDRNEKEIPVTKENKALLMRKVSEFREAVENGLKAIKEAEQEKTEEAEKNL